MKMRILMSNILLFGFLLVVYEGNVALWRDDTSHPIKVFPYSASMLPQADQQRLEKGIHVDSLKELYKMLEDYLS